MGPNKRRLGTAVEGCDATAVREGDHIRGRGRRGWSRYGLLFRSSLCQASSGIIWLLLSLGTTTRAHPTADAESPVNTVEKGEALHGWPGGLDDQERRGRALWHWGRIVLPSASCCKVDAEVNMVPPCSTQIGVTKALSGCPIKEGDPCGSLLSDTHPVMWQSEVQNFVRKSQ
ncbi:hypothetical protein BKA70DRAFT_1255208 [Coprinopsis sp. MPI-PUGE-AT-0042]|nr:hypothetical protein BKA70DRAFT_1255208 [Coprinopsis sp. MPI-PUGE-AT-0042]